MGLLATKHAQKLFRIKDWEIYNTTYYVVEFFRRFKVEFCLKEFLIKKQISAYKLAKMLSITHQAVYKWANNKTMPTINNLCKICTALGCTVEDLVKKN